MQIYMHISRYVHVCMCVYICMYTYFLWLRLTLISTMRWHLPLISDISDLSWFHWNATLFYLNHRFEVAATLRESLSYLQMSKIYVNLSKLNKLNINKQINERLLNVLCTLNLRPVSRESTQMRENTDQRNSEYELFSRRVSLVITVFIDMKL